MSSFATAWAWDQQLEQNEKLLLLFLADNADRNGQSTDLRSVVADAVEACGIGSQTVHDHLESLERKKLLRRNERGYVLTLGTRKLQRRAFRFEV